MKKIISLVLIVLSVTAYAQTDSMRISLRQAIELGLKNRYDVQAQQYDLDIANTRIAKSKKEWLPEISANGNVRYSPQLQATYIPAGFFGPDPALVALGASSTTVLGLDLNQPIYKPAIGLDAKIAESNLALEKEKNKADENKIREQIALAYLNVLLKEIQADVAAANEQRFKEYAEVAVGKVKSGTLVENDYLKAKLDYENAKIETIKANQNYALAMQQLLYQVNLPDGTALVLTDHIDSLGATAPAPSQQIDVGNRTEIRQLLFRQEINKLEIRRTRQYALPSVSFYANYSQQFMYTNFDYTLTRWWSPFSYVGLRFSVPITGNFRNADNVREYQYRALQLDLDLKQKTADVNFEVRRTATELSNAQQNMQTAKSNYDLSKVIYENQKTQYTIGAVLYSSLLDTDRSLNTAEQNYVKAVYDYLLATINYQKAIGNY